MLIDHIILGMDFSPGSVAAAEWTLRNLAPAGELVLVHVLPADGSGRSDVSAMSGAESRLLAVCEALRFERLSTRVRVGDPAACIAEVAREIGASLVVVGPHRILADQPDTLSSTAERLVGCSPVPVLLVAGDSSALAARLLIPVEGGDLDPATIEWARMLETRFDAQVAIVHLTHADGHPRAKADQRLPSGAEPRWHQLTATRRPGQVFVDAVEGDAAAVIKAQADRFESDLVITDQGDGDLLRTARCPVLVTHATQGDGSPFIRGEAPAPTATEARR
jgi:nucleotide-binding universal stress UspA family protein